MTIVINHDYIVGTDTNIDAYTEESVGYAYNSGSGSNMVVNAAADNAQVGVSVDVMARMTGGTVPTGDQEIIGDCVVPTAGSNTCGQVAVRCATSGADLRDWYYIFTDLAVANETQLYRVVDLGFTLLDSDDLFNSTGVRTIRLRATGTNPVALTHQINATTAQSNSDSAASRLQSGAPGIGGYHSGTGGVATVDNVTVDDLVTAGGWGLLLDRSRNRLVGVP